MACDGPAFCTLLIVQIIGAMNAKIVLALFCNRITISNMKIKLIGRGGPGRGGGRKPLIGDAPLIGVTLKMSQEQREKLTRLGGAQWVRSKIDRAREPNE